MEDAEINCYHGNGVTFSHYVLCYERNRMSERERGKGKEYVRERDREEDLPPVSIILDCMSRVYLCLTPSSSLFLSRTAFDILASLSLFLIPYLSSTFVLLCYYYYLHP